MAPWQATDAARHDKKAKSPVAKRQWSDVANSVLKTTGDEGRAVREANAVVMKREMGKFKGKLAEGEARGRKRKVIERHG